MSRFNAPTKGATATTNIAGGHAFTESPELELVSILLTSFASDKFYRSADVEMARLEAVLDACPTDFGMKATLFARNEIGMRSISHVAAVHIARHAKGTKYVRRFLTKVCRRPDDAMEILALYKKKHGKPFPTRLKAGIARAFDKWDEYQLAKYRGEGKQMSLVDVVNICHPRPCDKNEGALKELVAGVLRSKDTWEAKHTEAGKSANSAEEKAQAKAETWEDLLKSGRLPYFALLRNLRNIEKQASPDDYSRSLALLTDGPSIKRSMVLPFRFLTAIDAVSKQETKAALVQAMDIACSNVPHFEGTTLVVVDVSGSMYDHSDLTCTNYGWIVKDEVNPSVHAAKAALFGAAIARKNNAILAAFHHKYIPVDYIATDSIWSIVREVYRKGTGGTDFSIIFRHAPACDRMIIISDEQGWCETHGTTPQAFKEYKLRTNCSPILYTWDIAGYGTLQFPEKGVFIVTGWSEKMFDLMKLLEQDREALIKRIEAVEL